MRLTVGLQLLILCAFFAFLAERGLETESPHERRLALDEHVAELHEAAVMAETDVSPAAQHLVASARKLEASLQSRGLLSEEQKASIQQEQLESASKITTLFSAFFFMLMSFYLIFLQNDQGMFVVKRSSILKRLDYCVTVNLYICFFSCLFNTIQFSGEDDIEIPDVNHTLDLARPIEWMLTCPLMQLCICVVGGEKVPDRRFTIQPLVSLMILIAGTASALSADIPTKIACYIAGSMLFMALCYLMNETVRDATDNNASVFTGSCYVRGLTVITIATWLPFPIWYALSPEGFNIITNSAAMKIAVSFLNLMSKGSFTWYLVSARQKERLRTSILQGKVQEAKKNLGMDVYGTGIIQQALATIGHQDDFEDIMALLDQYMIGTVDDILSLTPEYCTDIRLPWSFVFAVKDQYRKSKISDSDAWQLQDNFSMVSPCAPHIAKNPEKLATVLKEQYYGGAFESKLDMRKDDVSSTRSSADHPMMTASPRSPKAQKGRVAPSDSGLSETGMMMQQYEDTGLMDARLEALVQKRVMELQSTYLKNARMSPNDGFGSMKNMPSR